MVRSSKLSTETLFDGSIDIRPVLSEFSLEIPVSKPLANALVPESQSAIYSLEEQSPDHHSPQVPVAGTQGRPEESIFVLEGSPQVEELSPSIELDAVVQDRANIAASSDPPAEVSKPGYGTESSSQKNMPCSQIDFSTTQEQTLHRLFGFTAFEYQTAEESESERSRAHSVLRWKSPEIADSQPTPEDVLEVSMHLAENHDEIAPWSPEQSRRAWMSNSDQGLSVDNAEILLTSSDVNRAQVSRSLGEAWQDEHGYLPDAFQSLAQPRSSSNNDIFATLVELENSSPDPTLYVENMSGSKEVPASSSSVTIVGSPGCSNRVDGVNLLMACDVAAQTTIPVASVLPDDKEHDVLHGNGTQTAEKSPNVTNTTVREHHAQGGEPMSARRGPDDLDISQSIQAGDVSEASFAASTHVEALRIFPIESQMLSGNSEVTNATHMQNAVVTSLLPPTPQLMKTSPEAHSTHSEAGNRLADDQEQVYMHRQASPSARIYVTRGQSPDAKEDVPTATPARKPARRSLGSRISYVPGVLSAWFSPRRNQRDPPSTEAERVTSRNDQLDTERSEVSKWKLSPDRTMHEMSQDFLMIMRGSGVTTSYGYYHPLASIERLLNPSSQRSPVTNNVDVLALVTDRSRRAERARSGPRDFYTVLKIHDRSLESTADVRVEIYRPWRAKLPEAEVGDVVLLRGFIVKSSNRQAYLLSTEVSAWCVWRYAELSAGEHDKHGEKPVWAGKVSDDAVGVVREEMKGPQVEFGDEERKYARALRGWWVRKE